MVADSAAATEGVKVALTVQEAPAAMLVPQVLDGEAKSAALLPLMTRLVFPNGMESDVLFVSVTVCASEVTPRGWTPKSRLDGTTAKVGIRVSFETNASDGPFRLI